MTSQDFILKGNSMTWSEKAHQAGVYLTIALGFFIPISTSLTDVLALLILVLWFLAGHYKTFVDQVKNPLVRASLLLFLVFIIAMIYTPVSFGEAGKMLKKYRELLYLIAFIPFLATVRHRTWAQFAFGLSMVVTLFVSFFAFYFPPEGQDINLLGHAFKDRVSHSTLMAAFAFGLMTYAFVCKNNKRFVVGLSVFFILATANLFFVVNGRTGYVFFYLLVIIFLAQQFKWRFSVYGLLVLLLLNFGLISFSSPYQQRVYDTATNILKYFNKTDLDTSVAETSIGQRLEFMANSYQLLLERPVFGHGTGSFKSRYSALAEAKGLKYKTSNPHNEYLMTGVQTGLVGISFLLYFIFCQFKYSVRLNPLDKNLALGLAAITAAGCMGNSILLDHTPGVFVVYFSAVFFSSLKLPEKTKDA